MPKHTTVIKLCIQIYYTQKYYIYVSDFETKILLFLSVIFKQSRFAMEDKVDSKLLHVSLQPDHKGHRDSARLKPLMFVRNTQLLRLDVPFASIIICYKNK